MRLAFGGGNADSAVPILNGDVEDAVVETLGKDRAVILRALALADDGAVAPDRLDIAGDLEAEAAPDFLVIVG